MNFKNTIIKIFSDNTSYNNPGQAVNQASSLNALSSDLYTDSKRFIYELLQNADDSSQLCEGVKVWIKMFGESLVFAHSGKPFSVRDLQGICNVNNGTKKSDLTKTGYKGIGFKSVFGQSDRVMIFSDKEYFRFDSSYSFEWKWKQKKSEWEQENERIFQFPWQIIPIYTEETEILTSITQFIKENNANVATVIELKNVRETSLAIDSLSHNLDMFLFLKNICEINFEITELVTVKIDRKIKDRITLYKTNAPKVEWLINTITLEVPREVKISLEDERNIPEKLMNAASIEVSLAAKVGEDGIIKLSNQEKLIYSYLPTNETKYSMPVLVNTSFLTNANREALHTDSKWNQWLFKCIGIEIFKWISKLVVGEFSSQAYRLIPKKIAGDGLARKFNEGIDDALKKVPFIISRQGRLIKIEETIVDFTYLSEKKFIGEEPIKAFINKGKGNEGVSDKYFAQETGFSYDIKSLGASCFEWKNLHSFLASSNFNKIHAVGSNIELIKHLKKLCDSGKVKDISKEILIDLPFIWDHKNNMNCPKQVCFPTADDKSWNDPNSDLSFLHLELQNWLHEDPESRHWLESLGVKEKTDITYITHTIIPKIEHYITPQNALLTIQDLFSLYRKGNLGDVLLKQLSRIKLLTQTGCLCPAEECFLSDYYRPRVEIEKLIEKDIFINEDYCKDILEKDEWKRFFKILGVQEGTSTSTYSNRHHKSEFISEGFNDRYFISSDKKFQPAYTTFTAYEFRNITTLKYIQHAENNVKFARVFWRDYITTGNIEGIKAPATAYWGHGGMDGQISGNKIENYVPWLIKNIQCIPTIGGECETSSSVFLNINEIKDIGGKYLPVFDGPELSADWKAFFNFKTKFKLSDYFKVLDRISVDVNDKGNIKDGNYKIIQTIYFELLNQCVNWSSEEIKKAEEWTITGNLLNTNNQFVPCSTLKYFLDGNEVIFQEQYSFINLSAQNKSNSNLEQFLRYLRIDILKESEFELVYYQKEICYSLKNKLKKIHKYLQNWIICEHNDDTIKVSLGNLETKIEELDIFEAEELKITYECINFRKNVSSYFDTNSLYVTKPWSSNSVLLRLSEVLCRHFHLIGHDKKLDFLLRSTDDEIRKYFTQEEIEIPEKIIEGNSVPQEEEPQVSSFADVVKAVNKEHALLEFFHLSKSDYNQLQYIEKLIKRSVENVLKHLQNLKEYDCTYAYRINDSIIGGIIKNGNEITIVARPSDNNQVLIYYTSELDVLKYVDAELWCEDGVSIPKQITLGELLEKTGMNRIPIKNIEIEDDELEILTNKPKSEELDFNAVPDTPQKIAKILASFANTNGGTLIFGVKEILPTLNEIVGLSTGFPVVKITRKAILMLSPIPQVTYEWVKSGDKSIFVIKIQKANQDILLENKKYIRKECDSVLEENIIQHNYILNTSKIRRNVAIIIAIENYAPKAAETQIPSVKYAINDAIKFKEMLINTINVDENDIYMIQDEEAMKSTLEYEFTGLFYSLKKEDRLIFYYVGHGFHNGITNYLSTYDMHKYHISETAISLRKVLLDPLKKSKCENALIFIDACAQIFEDENERGQIADINDEELRVLTSEFPYYAMFLSCQAGQSSYSSDVLEHGIWTYHLVNAISGGIPEVVHSNKYITDRLLQNYLAESVCEYTKDELGKEQNPKVIIDSTYENIIVELEK